MDDDARSLLRQHGWEPGEILGSGTEGTVVALSPDEVAKVWHVRPSVDYALLRRFGDALAESPLPFRCSYVSDVIDQGDQTITIEQRVPGRPLRLDLVPDPPVVTGAEVRVMGDALAGLSLAAADGLDALPILPGQSPIRLEHDFGSSLADLVEDRFLACPQLLRAEIDEVDELAEATSLQLRRLPEAGGRTLVHGDLIPANVLVDDGAVSGVVDFGFLTTLGDPQFDAAITASIFDMYGPWARVSEQRLTEAFVSRFDHDPMRYGLYRAAYALITNAWFAEDRTDGHFRWCAAMLNRRDIRVALAPG